MKRARNFRQAGYSLAEILVAVAIFALIAVAALMVYDRSNRDFKQGVESADMQQATRIAFDRLMSDLRMVGFDYDRDGTPSTGLQQPDEQIEFAGVSAITMRGNLDYYTDAAEEHGLEDTYAVTDKFPVVTTGNDEIVTYALRSQSNPAANVGVIRFYADVASPRAAYPGGTEETLVSVGTTTAGQGFDLCGGSNIAGTTPTASPCTNPPYTLYRIKLKDDGTADAPVPIAENIRSLRFYYYSDLVGNTQVMRPGTPDVAISHGALGGLGQYDPDSIGTTANFAFRERRGDIRSVRVELTGMTAAKDFGYVNPDEPLTAYKAYRTYKLESLIVPRNLGLRGSEDPAIGLPGAPNLLSICTGHCGVTRVRWSGGSGASGADEYHICYDVLQNGAYSTCTLVSLNLEEEIPIPAGGTYWIKIKAVNEAGATFSSNPLQVSILNRTTPEPPDDLAGADGAAAVALTWTRPDVNVDPNDELACVGTGGSTDGTQISDDETLYYWVYRGTSATFTTASTDAELAVDNTNNNRLTIAGDNVSFNDNYANKRPLGKGPANCTNYWYRIQTRDSCTLTPASNLSSNAALAQSTVYPTTDAIGPFQITTSTAVPKPVSNLSIDIANSTEGDATNNENVVKLVWTEVNQDTSNAGLPIDTYRIRRWRKVGATEVDVTTREVSGTLLGGTTAEDRPLHHNPSDVTETYVWFYTVQAKNCGQYGGVSNEVRFPTCTFNDSVIDAPDSLGDGDGLTEDTAWILAGGDSINVTNTNRTLQRVTFVIPALSYPHTDIAPSAFSLPWIEQEGETFAVFIYQQDSDGCVASTEVRYVKDQLPAGCTVELLPAGSGTSIGARVNEGGNVFSQIVTHNITNSSDLEDATLTGITFTFANPATYVGNGASNFELDSITYASGSPSDATDRTPASYTVTLPVGLPAAARTILKFPGAAYSIAFKFKYRGDRYPSAFTATPISALCLSYTLASEGTTVKRCNVIGTETNNPDACHQ